MTAHFNKYGSKYRNERVIADGERFDSRKEYLRWRELQLLQKSGVIRNLERQKKFILLPSQDDERPVSYVADFVYTDNNGQMVVEDVKGIRTDVYIIKRKLMQYIHGIKIKET